MKRKLIIFFFFIFHAAVAQNAGTKFSLHTSYGFVFRHADKIGQASLTHPYSLEISYSKLMNGSKEWHKPFRYPEVGVSAGFMDFHSNLLGKAFYAFPYFEKTVADLRFTQLNIRLGFGGAYLSNPYDPETNFQNVAVSTHLNYLLRGEGSANFKLSDSWRLKLSVALTHFSNGGFKQPNSGINIIGLGVGLAYLPHFQDFSYKKDTFTHAFQKGFSVDLAGAFTVQEIEYPGGKKYFGGNFISYLNYRLNRKSAVNIGLDIFFNSAHKMIIDKNAALNPKPDFKQAGLTLGHELFIRRLSWLTQIGYYVYAPQPNQSVVYQRYAFKYWWTHRFYSSLSLKAHFGTAEYTEWTVGWRFADSRLRTTDKF